MRTLLAVLAAVLSPLLLLTRPPTLVQVWLQNYITMGSCELCYVVAALNVLSVAALRGALLA